jgi:hypothetical protein
MLRALSRLLGFLLLAAGFVGVVFDGARSIANNGLRLTTLGEFAGALLKERYAAIQAGAEANHATLWHLVGAPLAGAPVALLAVALGVLLLWLGQPARDPQAIIARR